MEALTGGGQKGGGPNLENVWPRREGAPNGGAKISRFFFPPPATIFFLPSLSWGSRGILVVFEAPGPSNVHVWSSRVVECEPRRPHCPAEGVQRRGAEGSIRNGVQGSVSETEQQQNEEESTVGVCGPRV